ncbi:MAG: hypothetical protein HDS03_07405 [Bacteroides sp.]|nr:hypothetical protein [Bacteroides sp.]
MGLQLNIGTQETKTRLRIPNKNEYYWCISWIFILISPLLSLPLILVGIWNKQTYSVFQLIIFFGIVAFLFPPSGDLYRYYNLFYLNFKGIRFNDIFNFYIFDFIWYAILYLLVNLDIPFQYGQVISCFLQLGIVSYILSKQKVESLNNKNFFLTYLLSFIITGFWTSIELRFYLALSFFILSVFWLTKKRHTYFYIFIISSIFTHYSFIFIALLLTIGIIFKRFINIKTCIFIGIIMFAIVLTIGQILDNMGFDKAGYITNSTDWTENSSFILRLIKNWLMYLPLITMSIILLKKKDSSLLYKISILFLTITLATLQLPDLNSRFKIVTTSLIWLYFVTKTPYYTRWITPVFYSAFFVFVLNTATSYRALTLGKYEDLILPTPIIFFIDSYNDYWIQTHINDGNIYKLTHIKLESKYCLSDDVHMIT